MLSSMNTIADIETLYARLGERDYEAVMSYLAKECIFTLGSIAAGIAPVRWRTNRLRRGHKRKASEHDRDEKESKPQTD